MENLATLLLAGYGALLSSVLAFLKLRSSRPRISIFYTGQSVGRGPELAAFVVNTGQRPITIAHGSFLVSDGGSFCPPANELPDLPAKLEEGDQLRLTFPIAEDLDLYTSVGFFVEDTHRRRFVGRFTNHEIEQGRLFQELFSKQHQELVRLEHDRGLEVESN